MIINCPDCRTRFNVAVTPVDPGGRRYVKDSPITPRVLRAVLEWMVEHGPAKVVPTDAWQDYLHKAELPENEWPKVSRRAFVDSLRRNGATRTRNAQQRLWTIPEIPEDQQPAKAAPSVQKRLEQEAYEEAVQKYSQPIVTPTTPARSADDILDELGAALRAKKPSPTAVRL